MTESTKKALEIIKEKGPIKPKRFAKFMWPDSDGWSTHTNCGHGVTRGGGMNLAAGGYLGKLRKRGLIEKKLERWPTEGYRNKGYILSKEGKKKIECT
jgi:hypothetical protein